MNKDVVRQVVNLAAVIVTLAINGLSQALPFNNQTSAEIANRFTDNYFLPANYVFSIWGVIYIGLIAFGIFQALPAQRENPRLRRVGYWFLIGSVGNSAWLFLFHYELFALSTVAMVALLVSLVITYLRVREGAAMVSTAERLCVRVPFSIYLGWITVATVANFTYVLLDMRWDGFGVAYEIWGIAMIIIAALIAGAFAFINRDVIYAAVIVWSFAGILVRHVDVNAVAAAAGVMAVAVGAVAIISFLTRHPRNGLQPGRA